MFYKTLTLCIGLLFMAQFTFAQSLTPAKKKATLTQTATTSTTVAKNYSTDVKAFGLAVVKNYFDQNCDDNYNLLADEIMSFESGQKFQKSAELKKMYCEDNPLRTDIQVSYQAYLDNYTQTVMTQPQLEAKYPGISAKLGLKANDYFFNGATPVAAGAIRQFRASDVASFLVRKIDGQWKVVAL